MTVEEFANDRCVLVTGGCGYIGSHTVLELLYANYKVVVIDNLCNSSQTALKRVKEITGKAPLFYAVDVRDKKGLVEVFQKHPGIWAVIHFAGLKAVGESSQIPLHYYESNVSGTVTLLQAMKKANIRNIVFSSSATVYGNPPVIPIPETSPLEATNPYGRTKHFIEEIIRDACAADKELSAVLLRYFNPAGAHPSGRIGENPRGIPNNLMPFVSQVAIGQRSHVSIFGNDYKTRDGTCIRDYIHVVDLALGHLAALEKVGNLHTPGCLVYNLGTGRGTTVLEMIAAMSKAVGKDIPYEIGPRRPGDVTNLTADPTLANIELNWKAELSIDRMCADLWRWQSMNPEGFADA